MSQIIIQKETKNDCETKDKYPRKEGKPKKKPL